MFPQMPQRNQPILPYVFYDLSQTGKTWRVLLQVNEGFVRLEDDTREYLQENLYPTIVKFLSNAGRFPEVNRVTLLKDSNTFAVRLNLTWAYSKESAEETIYAIAERLDAMIINGTINNIVRSSTNPTRELSDFSDKFMLAPEETQSLPEMVEDNELEEVSEESFSAFLDFLNEPDDDDNPNDDNHGLPVPVM